MQQATNDQDRIDGTGPVRASAGDVEDLAVLRDTAARWMVEHGIAQWEPGEVGRETFAAQVTRGEWWLVRDGRGLAGAVRVLWADTAVWGDRPEDAAYVHGLVVARDRTGQGVGRGLLDWASRRALAAGRPFVRLDCVETNAALRDYYAAAGYREVGRRDVGGRWRPVVLLERRVAAGPTAGRLAGLVLRCADVERSAAFYRDLGLVLVPERHGDGPAHYSTDLDGTLLELYPATAAPGPVGPKVRLTLALRREAGVLTDPDGRRVETVQTGTGR